MTECRIIKNERTDYNVVPPIVIEPNYLKCTLSLDKNEEDLTEAEDE